MRPFILYFIILFSIFQNRVNCQDAYTREGDLLENLFSRLSGDTTDMEKERINDSIRVIIDRYVRSDSVFSHRFYNVRYLGQITSRDSVLKIIAWNLNLRNGKGKYFCYLIRKAGNKNLIYNLSAPYNEQPMRTDRTYAADEWYGALYYDLKPFVIGGRKCWVLLGLDYGNPLISRKLIDVLSFTPEDSLFFGRKCFENGDEMKFREVFEYSSGAMMSLRFASDTSIVFDHLVPFGDSQKDNHQYYGPDYSYDAFIFEKGIWKFTLNVDARNRE